MGKNKKNKQLDLVKNTNSPHLPATDGTPGKKKKRKNKNLNLSATNDKTEVVECKKQKKNIIVDANVSEESTQDLVVSKTPVKSDMEKKKKKKKKKQKNVGVGNSTPEVEENQDESCTNNTQTKEDESESSQESTEADNVGGMEETKETQVNKPAQGQNKKKNKKKNLGAKNGKNVAIENMGDMVESSDKQPEESQQSNPENDKKLKNKMNKRKLDKGKNNDNESAEGPTKKKKKGNKKNKSANGEEMSNDVKDSGKENAEREQDNKAEEVEEADIGQWSTAEFEDAERQDKFIKLLGGKKQKEKNFSGIQQKLFSIGMSDRDDFKNGGGAPAMSWKQQDNYMDNMVTDFEKARESHFGRGGGFGYNRPFGGRGRGGRGGEGRGRGGGRGGGFRGGRGGGVQIAIDTTKSKSIKFDD